MASGNKYVFQGANVNRTENSVSRFLMMPHRKSMTVGVVFFLVPLEGTVEGCVIDSLLARLLCALIRA